jgi:cytochrome c biogenesis protein CcmG/thiol:disulfide interchange protein DsbE
MQPKRRRWLSAWILIAGLLWIFSSADRSGASTGGLMPAPRQGFLAPEFTLKDPHGTAHSLSELRGRPVLVTLWATWCQPCRAEMPLIQKMYEARREQGFVVLAVNATVQDDPFAIAPFIDEYGLTFPVLLDETGEVASLYELRSLPTSFFIRRDGVIAEVVVGGPMTEALLQARIDEILK